MQKVALFLAVVFILVLAITYKKEPKLEPKPEPKIEIKEKVLPKAPPVEEKISLDSALKLIDKDELEKNVSYLASQELEGRMSGKKGNIMAAEYIANKLKSCDISYKYQKFDIKRLNSGPKKEIGDDFTNNIIAYIEGEDKDKVVVIGAHLDHIGYGPSMSRSSKIAVHPGADDNASGSAALMEVAEAFSKYSKQRKLKKTVSFQFYSGEEMGLLGSRFYCENPILPLSDPSIKKHVAMINMDMIGYLNKGSHFASEENISSAIMKEVAAKLKPKYSFATSITSFGTGGSDHAPFYNKRVPIAFIHTGLHAHYHTPTDTADKLNYDGMEKISRYVFEYALTIVGEKDVPFNHDGFKVMEYDHDHGGVNFHNHEH